MIGPAGPARPAGKHGDVLELGDLGYHLVGQPARDDRGTLCAGKILERNDEQPGDIGRGLQVLRGDSRRVFRNFGYKQHPIAREQAEQHESRRRELPHPPPQRRRRLLHRSGGPALAPRENRNITAFRHRDQERIIDAGSQIIVLKRPTHPAGLDAHHRIGLRVERGVAAENLDRDGIGLQALGPAGDRFLNHIFQEPADPVRNVEVGAGQYSPELRADFRLQW